VTITPDTKDWTWVLRRPCPECGFDCRDFPRTQVGAMLRSNAASWREVLAAPDVRTRPRPDVWSPLEYACHVRDVHKLYVYRLGLMLGQDGPRFPNWDQDETALADDYGAQDPVVVAGELADVAETHAAAYDAVDGDRWERTGERSDGARFTVETIARYIVHDVIHHLYDVTRAAD
jgi:hypothetical protein